MQCFPLKIDRCFARKGRFHLQGRIISQARNHHEAGSTLYGVIPQKTELFITIAVRISNPVLHVILLGNRDGKRPLETPRRWKENIQMNVQKKLCGVANKIQTAICSRGEFW
jgi:hypothetical protein